MDVKKKSFYGAERQTVFTLEFLWVKWLEEKSFPYEEATY